MSCFPCFGQKKKAARIDSFNENVVNQIPENPQQRASADKNDVDSGNITAKTFTFHELATATKNFRPECLLGEGGFGRVYKGCLGSNNEFVAVKQLDRNGSQENKEFLAEVLKLGRLHHQNLLNLIGYYVDGGQRLLVYEYMPSGSVEDHLLEHKPDQKPLDWYTRMKIATGAAKGLEYLHDKANPPVIYRDLKASNILLDEDLNPKLSDFGLANLGLAKDKTSNFTSRAMRTYGYCAPEYATGGVLTLKSDIYSFGVVLLELISGRRAIDTTKSTEEQNLVTWAQPIFKSPKRFPELVDPLLKGTFPVRDLNQAVAVCAMCLQEEPDVRPWIADVVTTLSFLALVPDPAEALANSDRTSSTLPNHPPTDSFKEKSYSSDVNHQKDEDESGEHSVAVAKAMELGSSSIASKSDSSESGDESGGTSASGASDNESDHSSDAVSGFESGHENSIDTGGESGHGSRHDSVHESGHGSRHDSVHESGG